MNGTCWAVCYLSVRRLLVCKEKSMQTSNFGGICNKFLLSVSCESPGFLLIPDRLPLKNIFEGAPPRERFLQPWAVDEVNTSITT